MEFHRGYVILKKSTLLDQIKNWIDLRNQIKLFNSRLRNDIPNGQVKIRTNLSLLKTYETNLEQSIIGRGLTTRSYRAKWAEMRSAFNCRIRTGIITNISHKQPQEFFEDAYHLFEASIVNALKETPTIKVKTIFSGNYKKKTMGFWIANISPPNLYHLKWY